MKKLQLFYFVLIMITSFIFSWVAETLLGEALGYTAIVIALLVFSVKTTGKVKA